MLINNALMGGESEVAMAWSRRLATYPTLLPTGAYGDDSADWTHLPLVQVRQHQLGSGYGAHSV